MICVCFIYFSPIWMWVYMTDTRMNPSTREKLLWPTYSYLRSCFLNCLHGLFINLSWSLFIFVEKPTTMSRYCSLPGVYQCPVRPDTFLLGPYTLLLLGVSEDSQWAYCEIPRDVGVRIGKEEGRELCCVSAVAIRGATGSQPPYWGGGPANQCKDENIYSGCPKCTGTLWYLLNGLRYQYYISMPRYIILKNR